MLNTQWMLVTEKQKGVIGFRDAGITSKNNHSTSISKNVNANVVTKSKLEGIMEFFQILDSILSLDFDFHFFSL
jgi:hypothetical protein